MNGLLRVGDVAKRAGVSDKAIRHYERLGLLRPNRSPNGYRAYTDDDVAVVVEIKTLNRLGIPLEDTRPFIDCFKQQRDFSCPSSLAAYRHAINDLLGREATLREKRLILERQLALAAGEEISGPRVADRDERASGSDRPAAGWVATMGGRC